jgi:ATP-dependent helicase HrpA
MRHAATSVTDVLYPPTLHIAGGDFPLDYRFAPGHPLDGLSLSVPLARLNQVDPAALSWLVPGMVREKVTLLVKALPKTWRNRLIPVPDTVTEFLERRRNESASLEAALHDYIAKRLGDAPSAATLAAIELPAHLRVNVRVVDASGDEIATDRDVGALQERLREAAQLSFAAEGPAFERTGLRHWDFGELPQTLSIARGSERVTGYPALVDATDSVTLTLLDTEPAAAAATRRGVARLIAFELGDAPLRPLRNASAWTTIGLHLRGAMTIEALQDDARAAVIDRAYIGDDPLPRDRDAFVAQVRRARTRLPAVIDGVLRLAAAIAADYQALTQALASMPGAQRMLAGEIRAQRDALVYPGFLEASPWESLHHVPRYLQAMLRRIQRYGQNPERDARHASQVNAWWSRYRERRAADGRTGRVSSRLAAFRWLIEELRVSLFAQELRTPIPVSFKRLEKAWHDIDRDG